MFVEVRELMHDMRNHLSGVMGLVSLWLLQSSDPASARFRPLIESEAQQLMHLADRVHVAVGGVGSQLGKPQSLQAPGFASALIDLYRPFATEHGVRLSQHFGEDLPPMRTDSRSLHRLLSNLIVNAIKHARASQVTLFVESAEAPVGLRFVVVDNGVGMAPSAVRLLQSVLSGVGEPTAAYDRSGLAICARMAAQIGATLTLRSELGDGTSVTIDLASSVPAAQS